MQQPEWENGSISVWENERTGEWENERIGEWENERIGVWENERIGEWENGSILAREFNTLQREGTKIALVHDVMYDCTSNISILTCTCTRIHTRTCIGSILVLLSNVAGSARTYIVYTCTYIKTFAIRNFHELRKRNIS